MKNKSISAAEFEAAFDSGEDMLPYLDLTKLERPGLEPRRVSVDFPEWMVQELDRLANHLGITRQSLIKVYIADRLKLEEFK
jgi:hypothetical protein